MPLQIRRGSTTDRLQFTPLVGELIYDTQQKVLYVGDGETVGGRAGSTFTAQESAEQLTGGFSKYITYTYDTENLVINTDLNLSSFSGTIGDNVAFNEPDPIFYGSILTKGSTVIYDSTLGTLNLNSTVGSDITPMFGMESLLDIGSPASTFRTLWLSTEIHLGSATINSVGTTVDLPPGSTVGGIAIGSGDGDGIEIGGEYEINIMDFSGVNRIVDSENSRITALGGLYGNLTGSVFGDDSTVAYDAISNSLYARVDNELVRTRNITVEGSGTGSGILIRTNVPNTDYDLFTIEMANNTPNANSLFFLTSRGTVDEPTALLSSQRILDITYAGFDLNGDPHIAAQVSASLDGPNVSGAVPGRYTIRTSGIDGVLRRGLSINRNQVLELAPNVLVAGSNPGEVDTSAVATYLKIIVGTTEYAMPLYNINPTP